MATEEKNPVKVLKNLRQFYLELLQKFDNK